MKITKTRNHKSDPAWLKFRLQGFERRRPRSQRGDKYAVLARLVTGAGTDSDSDLEYFPDGPYTLYHPCFSWLEKQKAGWVSVYKRERDWDAKRWAKHLPKFRGHSGELPLAHIEKLEKRVALYSSGSSRHINVYLVIAFPQSLEGPAREWFDGLPRRKFIDLGTDAQQLA